MTDGGTMSSLDNRTIHIIGPKTLQNELMASFLRDNGARCYTSAKQIPSTPKDDFKEHSPCLFLIDCHEIDVEKILVDILREEGVGQTLLMAIFNVKKGSESGIKALEIGIRGIFYDHDTIDSLLKGIEAIFRGELWISREIMGQYFIEQKNPAPKKMLPLLTKRELEILLALTAGSSNEELSDKFFISAHTVKTHIYNIYKKIQVSNRVNAIIWAKHNLDR